MEEAGSLILIPDISGFTNFVRETEISHSEHIISELLEVIINSNLLDLEIAEIEGDAIFFYRKNFIPMPDELITQVKRMFINFHNHLKHYEWYRICHCGACRTASNLSLKFIAHFGKIGYTRIQNIEKPHGEDVILAHRLLKNDIDHNEYLLLSDNLLNSLPEQFPSFHNDSQDLIAGSSSDKTLGTIGYKYISLSPLHKEVGELPAAIYPRKSGNPIRFHGFIDAPKEKVYEIASNLQYRMSINRNASKLDFDKERVNRVGTVHQCTINNLNYQFQTVSNDFGTGKLVYGELLNKTFAMRKKYTYMIFEDDKSGTRLQYEVHLEPIPVISMIITPVFKRVVLQQLKKLFNQLKEFCESTDL